MSRLLLFPLFVFALFLPLSAGDQTVLAMPKPVDSLVVPAFTSSAPTSDSVKLQKRDSLFIFGGEQYFRARASGKEFFVARDWLLAHADSLIVYQYYRLLAKPQSASSADTAMAKVQRQQCTMITKNGTRCKRLAEPGSNKCWQHKK